MAKMSEKGIVVELNESSLLAGLIEGRSGSFIDGWSNTAIKLKRPKLKSIDAEDIYARSGMRFFEISNDN